MIGVRDSREAGVESKLSANLDDDSAYSERERGQPTRGQDHDELTMSP